MAATREIEVAFLLGVAAQLSHAVALLDGNEDDTADDPTAAPALTAREQEVLGELLLLENKGGAHAAMARPDAAPSAEVEALMAESPLATMYAGEANSAYTRFILSFYSSVLYAQVSTRVSTAAIRLFQRFLCGCRTDTLAWLRHSCGANALEYVLRECINLAGNLSSTVQIAAPSEVTGTVLGELDYDVQEVSPFDYLDVLLPHVPYLSQMCQQAALLLMAHEEMVLQPSSVLVLTVIAFTVRNVGAGDDAVARLMARWPESRQSSFHRMNEFLNCFALRRGR